MFLKVSLKRITHLQINYKDGLFEAPKLTPNPDTNEFDFRNRKASVAGAEGARGTVGGHEGGEGRRACVGQMRGAAGAAGEELLSPVRWLSGELSRGGTDLI